MSHTKKIYQTQKTGQVDLGPYQATFIEEEGLIY